MANKGKGKIAAEASDNAIPPSAPEVLPSQPKEKRPRSDTKATTARKRQKAKEVKVEEIQGALTHLSVAWESRAGAAAAWRRQIPSEQGSTLELLVKSWNVIRAADGRPALTDRQASLVPKNEQLHSFLSHVFVSPLSWEAANFPTVLKRHDVLEEPASNKVQFYIRRLQFENRDALLTLLGKVRKQAPQYAGQINNLLAASAPLLGSFFVSYGGYTVANSPVGRDLDDKDSTKYDSSGGFLKAVLKDFQGTRLVYEVLPLAFEIGSGGRDSVKLSRADSRTGLFESLVIDSFGFLCFNTAPAGTVIEMEQTVDFAATKAAIRTPATRQPFKWQIPAPASSSSA